MSGAAGGEYRLSSGRRQRGGPPQTATKKAKKWITQGLMQMQGVAVSSVPDAEALRGVKEDKDKVRMISRATRAGKVVTGAYYLEAETLRFVAQVQDALHGGLLSAVEPESGAVQEPFKIIETDRAPFLLMDKDGHLQKCLHAELIHRLFFYGIKGGRRASPHVVSAYSMSRFLMA